ncbi:MAG: hypothetical protein AB7U23_13720 [Dehalococcoidia bacterium]
MRAETRECYGGLPTWFKAACFEVRSGERTYRDVGRHLAGHLPGMLEEDVSDDGNIDRRLDELREALRVGAADAAAAWLRREVPRLVRLVPARKMHRLIEGLTDEYEANGLAR